MAKGDGMKTGVSTGLGLTGYLNKLFGEQPRRKLADDDLYKAVAKEFPKRAKEWGFQAMSAYRSYHNQGLHGQGSNPGKPSKPQIERYGGPQTIGKGKPWAERGIERAENGKGGKEAKVKKAKVKGKAKGKVKGKASKAKA